MREIKFRYFFTNHAPVVFSLIEIEALAVSLPVDMGKIAHRAQYIGLKDANGVEIYEGDVIAQEWIKKERYDSGEFVYGVIKFVRGSFVEAYKISEKQEDFEKIDGENCVVVGNIYQNPELLK